MAPEPLRAESPGQPSWPAVLPAHPITCPNARGGRAHRSLTAAHQPSACNVLQEPSFVILSCSCAAFPAAWSLPRAMAAGPRTSLWCFLCPLAGRKQGRSPHLPEYNKWMCWELVLCRSATCPLFKDVVRRQRPGAPGGAALVPGSREGPGSRARSRRTF